MKLVIPIEPKAQTRPRFSKWGTYEDPKTKRWRKSCTYYVLKLYRGKKLDGPLKVDVSFYTKAPQKISDKPSAKARLETIQKHQDFCNEKIHNSKKPDLDNYIKAVFDSISDAGNIWIDDNQVCELTARKLYSPNPRIEIEINEALFSKKEE